MSPPIHTAASTMSSVASATTAIRARHERPPTSEPASMASIAARKATTPPRDLGPDPVEPVVPGDALDDADDRDEGARRDHRPDGPLGLGAGAVGVVADEEEGGHGQELQRLPPRRVPVERKGREGLQDDE